MNRSHLKNHHSIGNVLLSEVEASDFRAKRYFDYAQDHTKDIFEMASNHIQSIKLLPFLFAFIPHTLYLLFSSCQTDIQTISQITITGKNLPSETMKAVELIYSDSAKVKMKLTGEKLERFGGENPHVIFPVGVKVLFYDDSLKVNSQLKANWGIRYETGGKMEVKRNVEVVNIKGEKLNTEHLIFDETKDRIFTEEFVRITTHDEVIYGDGLESNQDFTKYRIKNIKGTISMNGQ